MIQESPYSVLEKLASTSESEVFLVSKKGFEELFLLKTLKTGTTTDSRHVNLQKRFKKEIDVVSSLSHKNISKLHDSFSLENNYSLIYPYKKGKSLSVLFSEHIKFQPKEALIIISQLLDALEYIHSRGIVHCDINPNNIFLSEQNEIELFDFGLSISVDEARDFPEGVIIGTIPYVAPEQMGFTDFKIDTRTDLYDVALILYRLLADKLPFPVNDISINDLLNYILKKEIRPLKNIPTSLNQIVLKGLKPSPDERYQTASGFKYDIQHVLKTLDEEPTPSLVIGEKDHIISINRGKLFVGRNKEIEQLEKSFSSFKKNDSSSFLIYGPSGIGKTEVVRKFKDSVLSKKVLFISSKCNRFTPHHPYSVYREIILDSLTEISKKSEEAKNYYIEMFDKHLAEFSGLICSQIPEMTPYFKEIKETSKVEEEKEAERLIYVLFSLLKILTDIQKTVFFIDDIQWIDRPTFLIIKTLLIEKSSCFLILSYRTNNEKSDLLLYRENLKTIGIKSFIEIAPFQKADVQEFIFSRFGKIDNHDQLIDPLFEKTEGSPYLLTEAIRYLINNNILKMSNQGNWFFIEEELATIPQKFDLVSLILNKFNLLKEEEKFYLELASLIEGKFEREIIESIGNFSEEASRAISHSLENQGFIMHRIKGGFSFTHDKIQESIASFIPESIKLALYENLGKLYESKINENKEYLFNAAECYLKSRNLENSISICFRAAKYASEKLAFDLAIRYFKTTSLMVTQGSKIKLQIPVDLIEIQKSLGDVLMLTGQNKQAVHIFIKLLEETPFLDPNEILELKYKIGSIYHNMGEFENSIKYFTDALRDLKIHSPQGMVFTIFALLLECIKQFMLSLGLKKLIPVKNKPQNFLTVRILNKYTYAMFYQNMYQALFIHFKTLNLADLLPDSYEKVETYTIHSVAAFQLFMKKRAFKYFSKVTKIANNFQRKDILAFSEFLGGLICFYDGKLQASENHLRKSLQYYQSIGDLWGQIVPNETLAHLHFHRGNFGHVKNILAKNLTLTTKCNDVRGKVLADHLLLVVDFIINRNDPNNHWEILEKDKQSLKNPLVNTLMDIAFLRKEILKMNLDNAYAFSQKTLQFITNNNLHYEYVLPAYSLHCDILIKEYLLRQNEISHLKISDEKLLKQLSKYYKNLLFLSLKHPAHVGSTLRIMGWYFYFRNRKNISKFCFKKSIKTLHSLDMKYEQAISLRDYADFLQLNNLPGDAKDHYKHAYYLFKQCNANMEIEYLKNKRDISSPDDDSPSLSQKTSSLTSGTEIENLRVDTFFSVSASLNAIDDIEKLLSQIADAMLKATGAQNCFIFIEKSGSHEEKTLLINFEGQILNENLIKFSPEIINWVKHNQKTMLVKNGAEDERLDKEKNLDIRSVLCVPLIRGNNYMGCVYLSNDRVTGLFTQGSEKAATILSSQAAILIENAYLMDSYKKLNLNLERKVKDQTQDIRGKNRQLEEYNLKLLESERMKDLLSGTLVHDIKNFSAGIEHNLKVLEKKYVNDEKTMRSLNMAKDSCKDIIGLASNLLDISKMEEGKLDIKPQIISNRNILNLIKKLVENPLFEEKEIEISLPLSDESFEVNADPYFFERVLQNLFNNASKYTPRKGNVAITIESKENQNIVGIYNSGAPIPPDAKDSLFEKYSRLGDKRSQYSKGLGLYFCKMVLIAHKGKIWVESKDQGNCFYLSFPKISGINGTCKELL